MNRFILTLYCVARIFQSTFQDCVYCSNEQPTITAPHRNVWRPLSDEEFLSVSSVLVHKLNVTTIPDSSGRDNVILQIDLLQPNKSDVLRYLNAGAAAPKRFARATIQFGSFEEAFLQEYIVGPLPATNATSVQSLTYPFNNSPPGKSRIASIYIQDPQPFLEQLSSDIADITKAIWNTTIAEHGVNPRTGTVFFEEDGSQTTWATFLGPSTSGFDSISVLPLGIFCRLNVTSRDWHDWRVMSWYYHMKEYDSTEAFRKAVLAPGFEKPRPNVDSEWTSTDKLGDALPMDELPPPIPVAEGKKRFSIDENEGFVSWMDFDFYISTSTDQGLSLFDIHYKGERIIYELALQEALAHYAGADPAQSETLYFDSQGGLGRTMVPLIRGFDCPSYATYLNVTWPGTASATVVPDAICLFEFDANYPIRRHSAQSYTSVAKNVMFTVRSISTVGNYDYLFDYTFFLDGAIEVTARASGYISAAYYLDNDDYGFQIHDALSGSLHDHVMTYKVDFDILGEKNSFQKIEIAPATVQYPWSDSPRNTMRLVKSFVTNEADASLNWAPNDAVMYAVVNKESPNKFGEYPGYRVKRATMASHLTIKDSSNAGNAIAYATSDLFVTRQKDTEPRAADRNNAYDIQDPLVDFAKFLDGESLEQEDLVLWFNLGMHHVPHTGDLPNTLMSSAHSGMRLEPLNYLLGDPTVQTSQAVKINQTSGEVVTFGSERANCSVDLSTLNVAGM